MYRYCTEKQLQAFCFLPFAAPCIWLPVLLPKFGCIEDSIYSFDFTRSESALPLTYFGAPRCAMKPPPTVEATPITKLAAGLRSRESLFP